MNFRIPTRGVMGYRPEFLSQTSITGIMSFSSAGFGPKILMLVDPDQMEYLSPILPVKP